MKNMENYDAMNIRQLRSALVRKGFTNVSHFKTKMEMIEALEKSDTATTTSVRRNRPKPSLYGRMTVEELKEQMQERGISQSKIYTKTSMIYALEENDKLNPISSVKLIVNKVVCPRKEE